MLKGRCLCGRCSYEIEGQSVVVAHCHCLDCQRLSGSGHTTGAMFSEADIRVSGEMASFDLASAGGNTVTRLFCATCGSPLFGKNTGMPGYMTVTLGTLDDSSQMKPQVTIFARSRRDWDAVDESIPTFDAQPDWHPTKSV